MTRRYLLILFAATGLLGFGLISWTNLSDATVIASTGSIYHVLESHDLEEDKELRDELYKAVLQLQWPWAVVYWAGLAVLVLSAIGLLVASRLKKELEPEPDSL